MSKSIKPDQLTAALEEELTIYSEEVTEKVNIAGRKAMDKLVDLTRASAPAGARGKYRRAITSEEDDGDNGCKSYLWHAKGSAGRLTHLLVHGHLTRNGRRTKSNPFLHDALDAVLPEYEDAIKEAIME